MTKTEKVLLSLSLTVTVFAIGFMFTQSAQKVQGSVMQGGEYHSTTTSASTLVSFTVPKLVNATAGTLGSVIITGSGAGAITIYDATTTDATLRASTQSTSTITIASFPPSPTVGTYTFDIAFYRGLIYDVNGTQSTTTLTYRSNQ